MVAGTVLQGPAVGANGAVGCDLRTDEVYFEDTLPVDAQTELVLRMREAVPGTRCVSVRNAGRTFVPEHGYVGLMDPGDHGRAELTLPEYDLAEVLARPSLKLILRHDTVSEDALLAVALELAVPGCDVGRPVRRGVRRGRHEGVGAGADVRPVRHRRVRGAGVRRQP
jgi:hypothetical protein